MKRERKHGQRCADAATAGKVKMMRGAQINAQVKAQNSKATITTPKK